MTWICNETFTSHMIIKRGALKILERLNNGKEIQYFGKFKAYLFSNFMILSLLLLLLTCKFFLDGDIEVSLGMFVLLAGSALIAWRTWKSVEKKVPRHLKNKVFVAFCINGLLVVGKIVLVILIITIPFVFFIGGEFEYKEYTILDGPNRGETVFARNHGNGEVIDTDGKIHKVRCV